MTQALLASADGGAVLALFFVVALVVAMLVISHGNTKKRRQVWAAIAERLGLGRAGEDYMSGTLDGSIVEASIYTEGSGKNRRTYTRVTASGNLPDDVQLSREGFFSTVFGDDIKTGDRDFDSEVRVRGEPGAALALLDGPMRKLVKQAVGAGWVFAAGKWSYTVQKTLGAELEPLLHNGASLASTVRDAATAIPQRLAERVRGDANPDVRRIALELLTTRYSTTKATETAARSALWDAGPKVRLLAARHLGEAAVLANLTSNRAIPEATRAQALEALEQHNKHPEARAAIASLVDELSQGGLPQSLAEPLAYTLEHYPEPRAEAVLVNLLESPSDEVRVAAIRTLGKIGTVEAVPALVPLRDRFLAFASLQASEAKDAILAIQARAGRAEAGALALSEEGGGLALVEGETTRAPSPVTAAESQEG